MFKNKKFEVKVVDDKPQAQTETKPRPRLTVPEMEWSKSIGGLVVGAFLTGKIIDAAAEILIKKL